MITFNSLLESDGIDLREVVVLRHRPSEPELRKVLPWLAQNKPELYNAYQQTQSSRCEPAIAKATYVASFIAHGSGKALFVGLFERRGSRPLSEVAYWKIRAHQELRNLGNVGFTSRRKRILLFDLRLLPTYQEWKGRLIVNWPPPERSWWRRAHRNTFSLSAIPEESVLDRSMPPWEQINLRWTDLDVIPARWCDALREWRGIYFIFDESDAKGYVGSAYGAENILGRWLNYRKSGHGGNKLLRHRDPRNFRFSILQRMSPDMETTEVIRLESAWKERLHTREHGLNEN